MEVNFILNIEVGPPVANLRNAPQGSNGQHRESKVIVNGDLLLVLLSESGVRGRRKIRKWPIRDSGSGVALGGDTARSE